MSSIAEPRDTPTQRDDEVARLRVPPHSVEAEQSVLGGLLLDNLAWDRAAELLSESDFYRYEHRLIFSAVARLVQHSKVRNDMRSRASSTYHHHAHPLVQQSCVQPVHVASNYPMVRFSGPNPSPLQDSTCLLPVRTAECNRDLK